ncbi:hypothetical protein PG988_015242 [Apiospora saccharicola]
MSKPGGAPAEDSLLLDYPSAFFAWVPFKAASRRHWPVFLSGMAVLVISCAITPLQGALFKIERLAVSVDAPFLAASGLPPVGSQSRRMDAMLMNTAYATTFLEHPLPPFTTPNYALLPAPYQGGPDLVQAETNFTVATTKLATDLACWPATAAYDRDANSYTLTNGRGCSIENIPVDNETPYTMHYIGWETNSWSEYGLNQPRLCSSENSHQILVVWAKRYSKYTFSNTDRYWSPGQVEMTASFCETRYWKQRVLASLSSDQSVLHDEPLGPPETLGISEFNTTAFESFMSGGQPPDPSDGAGSRTAEDYIEHAGFRFGGNVTDLSVYSDPERLTKTFEAMHQRMFSLTVGRMNSLDARPDLYVAGTAIVPRYGITVSRRFAIAVESLLLVVAILNVCLLWTCRRGHSKLTSDPVSIREVANLAKQSNLLRAVLSGIDAESDDELRTALQKYWFCLRVVGDEGHNQVDIVDSQNVEGPDTDRHCSRLYKPAVPMVMAPLSGVVFVLVLIAALSYLAFLKVIERRSKGLSLPIDSQLALGVLENYVPIVFATLVESLWVLLNRLLAAIQPFAELQRGHSPGHKSIDLSLGALFNELPVIEDEPVEISTLQIPTINNDSLTSLAEVYASPGGFTDHFTIANVHWSTGSKLPPWLTEEYYFLPFDLDRMLGVAAASYTARTYGVTTVPSCKPLPRTILTRTNLDPPRFSEQSTSTGAIAPISAPWLKCLNATLFAENPFNRTGKLGTDIPLPLDHCGEPYYRAQVRAYARRMTDNESTIIRNVEITGVECQPRFATAEFDLTVDSTGRVLGANKVSDLGPLGWGPGNGSHVRETLERIAFDSPYWLNQAIPWYNTTDNEGTINFLLSLRNNSFVDPTTPLPDPEKLSSEIEVVTRMLNVALLQQNPSLFEKAASSIPTTQGTRRITVTKIFMADVAFIISMTLLSLNVVTAIVVYAFGPASFLPRFPDALGSVLGYVAKSRLTDQDWEPTRTSGEEDDSDGAEKASRTTYSFGRYTDRDGNEHLGIDADPFVIKVDREGTPEWQGQDNVTSWLARFRGKSSRRRESEEYIEG